MTDRINITREIVEEALRKIPATYDSDPLPFILSRPAYCALWADRNGWRYFLWLYWKRGHLPKTFRQLMRLSGATKLKTPLDCPPDWRFASRMIPFGDDPT